MAIVIPPAGVAPLSTWFGVPFDGIEDGPPVILADKIDPRTGELMSLFEGWSPADGAMITACRTHRSTGASVRNVGHELRLLDKVDEANVERLTSEAYRLSKHLVDAGVVEIVKVTPNVDLDDDWGEAKIEWRDPQTNERNAAGIER